MESGRRYERREVRRLGARRVAEERSSVREERMAPTRSKQRGEDANSCWYEKREGAFKSRAEYNGEGAWEALSIDSFSKPTQLDVELNSG